MKPVSQVSAVVLEWHDRPRDYTEDTEITTKFNSMESYEGIEAKTVQLWKDFRGGNKLLKWPVARKRRGLKVSMRKWGVECDSKKIRKQY